MAQFNTTEYAGQISTLHSGLPNGNKVSGQLCEFFTTYTTTGTEAAADIIAIVKLPVGAIFRFMEVATDGCGGTSVVLTSIGDLASAARYATGDLALTAASTNPLPMLMLGANAVSPFVVTSGDAQVLTGTLAGTLPMTAAKTITFRGVYLLP